MQVQQSDVGVAVTTVAGQTLHARLLIGCDGNRSAVRKHVQPDGDGMQYTGACVWRFFLDVRARNFPITTNIHGDCPLLPVI